MLFNSIEFLLFLPTAYIIYWFILSDNLKLRNLFLLIISYIFYGWWDWRFLSLIIFSSCVDYLIGQKLGQLSYNNRKRIWWLRSSLLVNLGLLAVFKYYNFFQNGFIELMEGFGYKLNPFSISIVLPVGISFYTFQTLSYTIDVYRGTMKPSKNWVTFFAYVSFFPQLVAGPIERAVKLLPQFDKKMDFDIKASKDGLRQILWGFFKKIVVADNCALIVNDVWSNYSELDPITLIFAGVLFAFQIYGDFSGYSDIAIGTARLFGFDLMRNFAYPYFSRDIAEFWRRWHISLSTWFRDYLYIPLGGSQGSSMTKFRNVMIIFLVSGFWHGANWTFIVWGLINGLFFIPLLFSGRNRNNLGDVAEGKLFASFKDVSSIILTFILTCLAWIFFRAPSITDALQYLGAIFSIKNFSLKVPVGYEVLAFIIILIMVEWLQRFKQFGLAIENMTVYKRWLIYYSIIFLILRYMPEEKPDFIYFQF